ncbi:hypothetical protein DAPPUDRAFT_267644 [Daphnia pulex]|uniref:Uncharacterized protein n=1 Tax=Daphnia pulex TaxID=6669 RepID=E9HWR8_DAPPU|nr:hypothetical protein DAPPUDRAFT_269233 [Daphnia pulex]EFX63812.1 hypothetical protein DAPPUDRAFT_267644 [Daphnia pulex]|eukprot:EFX63011.1 hypothetical protein DAPPUDRAFT_269233 [Daphnia pulex]
MSALTGIGFTFYFAILHWIEQEMAMGIGYAAARRADYISWVELVALLSVYGSRGENLPSSLNQLTGSLVVIAFTASVLVAAWKNGKPMLLVSWLVLKSVSLFVAIFYSLYFGVSSAMIGDDQGMSYVSILVIGIVLYSYSWLVIYTYYHELVMGLKKEAPINEKC